MISQELVDELKAIAFMELAKPINRVAACNSLVRNGLEIDRVRTTLFSIATDIATPDSVKVRAIDLLDKLDISTAPNELPPDKVEGLEQALMEQYVGNSK